MSGKAKYVIRPCRTLQELGACITLQRQIWGYADHEVYPLRLFVTISHIGGHVIGAFTARNELVGFVASMPALHGRRRYHHSLSLGVASAHQNQGLGRALKLAQREAALDDGIDGIEWTYDPMRAKNAFFNIERLGAIARRYLPDHYGPVQSRLQQGLPSDRLVAEWWLRSARAKHALAGESPRQTRAGPVAEVSIPAAFGALVEAEPKRGRELQRAVRQKLQQCFRRKLVITGFAIEGDRGRYRLEPLAAVGPRGRIV